MHRTGPEAPLAVTAPVIEAHAGPGVFDTGTFAGQQTAVCLGDEVEDPALLGPQPMASVAAGNAA
ncbi:hypothetical protein D3C71_1801690 [compost metagenome]